MRGSLLFAGVAACAAMSACFSPVIQKQCDTDADCGSGYRCIASQCIPGVGSGGGRTDGGTGGGAMGGGSAGGGVAGGAAGGVGAGGGGGGDAGMRCADSCDGCCAGEFCVREDVQSANRCGRRGQQCFACADGRTCENGVCEGPTTCDPMTCPFGCCLNGACTPFSLQNPSACGTSGASCRSCAPGETCSNGVCQTSAGCNAMNCNGCCVAGPDGKSVCVDLASQTDAQCGVGASACVECLAGSSCQMGRCAPTGCGPMSCPGCCQNGSCLPGSGQNSCGASGTACVICPAGTICTNGACQGCNANNCQGCCQSGFCQPGTSTFQCGNAGSACINCPTGTTCQNKACVPTTTVAVGAACTTDAQCAGLGGAAFCKRTTTPGGATYPGGYCTLRCGSVSACPTGSTCQSFPAQGESDSICIAGCTGGCRMGYACQSFGGTQSGCWLFPTPVVDAGVPDAGSGADAGRPTGSACALDAQCQSPSNAFCTPATVGGVQTGYIGGYCSQPCGPGIQCVNGGLCISESVGPASTTTCKSICFAPDMGQGGCRTGYVCKRASLGSAVGWCGPRCNNSSLPCPGGTTCNAGTGYCQ